MHESRAQTERSDLSALLPCMHDKQENRPPAQRRPLRTHAMMILCSEAHTGTAALRRHMQLGAAHQSTFRDR